MAAVVQLHVNIIIGVALLPFVDEKRLLSALEPKYEDLTEEENKRAVKGSDRLFVSKWSPAYDFLTSLYEGEDDTVSVHYGLSLLEYCRCVVRFDFSIVISTFFTIQC